MEHTFSTFSGGGVIEVAQPLRVRRRAVVTTMVRMAQI
jgi:hypothetical protein